MISCFQLKPSVKWTFCQMFFELVLKGFKLKKLVVDKKTAQPIELDEELIDPQLNQSSGAKKNLLYSRMVVQPVKGEQEPIDPHLNQSRSDQGAVKVQRSPVKH